jgi:teichuronic acid biosynthesis glycosyltransferase TuaH
MYNFVIISLSRFNIEFGSNIRDIAIELSKNHRVLYVDIPLKRKERWFTNQILAVQEVTERLAARKSMVKVNDNLWHYIDNSVLESINGVANPMLFDLVNYFNNKKLAGCIRRATRLAGFKRYILINDNDIYNGVHLKRMLKPEKYVYYLRDYLRAMSYWKQHASRLEPSVINSADLVLANSSYLAEYARNINPESYYVGQGCETFHFVPNKVSPPVPEPLRQLPRPLIGYMGALNSERLDIEVIRYIATELPKCSVVLLGKEDSVFSSSTLHQLPNVHFLGLKEYEALPAFLQAFDVAINPQAFNEITEGNYPRKIDEYLAGGKPVVATRTKAMEPFAEHVYLASTPAEYKRLIELALLEDSEERQQRRIAFAQEHTWPNSVKQMLQAINKQYHGQELEVNV